MRRKGMTNRFIKYTLMRLRIVPAIFFSVLNISMVK